MELPTGTIVDSAYRISAALRLGKDGDIYLGEPIAPGPPVMIHILRCALMEGDPGLEVFERAGRELCKFSHDAFPEVVDYGRFMVRPYIVTEKVEGRTLAEIVKAGELGSDQALRVINDTRDALQAAHHEGMAHGAMSADSVLINGDGEIKIVDLFNRWMTHQIGTKGAEIDTSADLHSLVEMSQLMMKGAKRVTKVEEAPVAQAVAEPRPEIIDDLVDNGLSKLPKKKFEADTADLPEPPPAIMLALAEEESIAPPPLPPAIDDDDDDEDANAPAMWADFTPEPEVEMGSPATVVVHTPDLSPAARREPAPPPIVIAPIAAAPTAPAPIVVAPKPAPGGVRLPPPPPQVKTPTPLPKIEPAARMMPAVRAPIQVKLPTPMMPVKAAPVPKPRVSSFVPTSAAMDFSDDPLLSPQLTPGYIEFFRRMLPRSGVATSKVGGENGFSKSLNLLLTCSIALLMLAAVLRF